MNKTTNDSKELLALNKPKGYLVTRSDDLGRKTVYDLLPDWVFTEGWMPIGRLDLESKGFLLFTTNSKINHALSKPGNCIAVDLFENTQLQGRPMQVVMQQKEQQSCRAFVCTKTSLLSKIA
jgi:pseudouridine synthase